MFKDHNVKTATIPVWIDSKENMFTSECIYHQRNVHFCRDVSIRLEKSDQISIGGS